MNDSVPKLYIELNNLMAIFRDNLSVLPSGSWQAGFIINGDTINIDILRNESLFIASFAFGEYADSTQWLVMFVPPVAELLAQNKYILPRNLKVVFNIKSEKEELIASCSAFFLVESAENGKINDFGYMMTRLDPEFVTKM